ncbi:MAG: uroporphyrinogen decarboxylase family protein [Lentisphaeria bacterium]|jgi:hypothetical protein
MATQRKLKWLRHEDLAIKRNPALGREAFLDWMTFRGGTEIPFTEIFGPLVGLKEEWEEQGATPAELDFSAFRFREPAFADLQVNTGRLAGWQQVVAETEAEILYQDDLGRRLRLLKGYATLPLPESWPVRDMDDWLAIKPKYQFAEERFAEGWRERALAARAAGAVIRVGIPGGFDEPRQLMGEERLCYAYYEQPELIHDILATIGATAVRVLDRATAELPVDCLCVHEDLAGKSGSLIGPREIGAFIHPYYRQAWDLLASRGARLFDQDSDGNMESVIPAFLAAGVNCMHPLEPAAGMDIVKLRAKFGQRLAFVGGLDKHLLRQGPAAIAAELEYKIPPMVRGRGCMLGLDHRIPAGTSLENYRFYLRKAWEIIERETAKAARG